MSDSSSESGSSSGDSSVSSHHPSAKNHGTNQREGFLDTEEGEQEGLEHRQLVQDNEEPTAAIAINREDKNLHLVWQGLAPDGDTDDQNAEARLIDFVVVPGIYATWAKTEFGPSPGSGSSAWVVKFAEEALETPRNHCRVLRFDYETPELFSGHMCREAIGNIASRLLSSLRSIRRSDRKKRLIYFISHDIGGIIVKDALVKASLERDSWQDISENTRVLVFNSCPHRQKDAIDLETRLASFLYGNYDKAHGKPRPSTLSISELSKAILQVNGLFIASHVGLRSWVINLHSYGEKSDEDFDAYCACLGIPFEKRFIAPADGDYSSLIDYLLEVESDLRETKEPVIEARQCVQERMLLALASPVYPLRNQVEPNLLADLPAYQSWLNSPSPQILYIHGSHRVSDVCERVFYALEEEATKVNRRANVLYFSFDSFDVRSDSIRDMIATFLAQICNHHPKLGPAINRLCCQIENERGWTEIDLIQFFEMFRISAEVEQTMIVMNHFDECTKGSRKGFLDRIIHRFYNEEKPWKIVVTSHKPGALSDELYGPFCVPIDISKGDLGDLAECTFESELQALIGCRGDFVFRESQIRDELRCIEELEPPIRHVVCEHLRVREEWPDEISTEDIFGSLNLSQDPGHGGEALSSVLHAVLKQYPEQDSIDCLFSWILYSVRPLTIWELATVVSFSTERERHKVSPTFTTVDKLVSGIEKYLAGVLEVDHNEVRFKHPRLREIMINGDSSAKTVDEKTYPWNRIKRKAHNLITSMCLDYLSRDAVQEYLEKTFAVGDTASFETPPFPDRTNLASYAIQAWTHHYSLSDPPPSLPTAFSKKSFVQNLAQAYWCLSNPATRRSPCFQSLFPIFSGLGLPNVFQPFGSEDALRGIIEAACKGQRKVVEELFDEYDITSTELWDVLQAASSSGNEELMVSILEKIKGKSETLKDFEWPPVLIYRAANLGLEHFADMILTLGCPPDPRVEWRSEKSLYASPLYLAACHGHTGTVQVLLKHDAAMGFTSLLERNPLHKAALEGHTETVNAILEHKKVDIDGISESKFTSLYLAVLGGNHITAKLLLEKGADPNMGIPDTYSGDDQWTPLLTATDDGFKKSTRLLLDNGANPNMPGPSGPPLFWAVSRGRVDILNMLLEAGANPHSELLKKPLLATAVSGGSHKVSLDMVKRLLELDMDVNEKDSAGFTVLASALSCWEGKGPSDTTISNADRLREEALETLLRNGADPNLTSIDKWSPLHFALTTKSVNAVKMLLEAGADPNTPYDNTKPLLFSALDQPRIAQLLLKYGADPNAISSDGFTLLTSAACFGYQEAAKALLEVGASVDLEYGIGVEDLSNDWLKGWTPVMCAAYCGHDAIVRLLAEAGADLQRRTPQTKESFLHLNLRGLGGTVIPTAVEFSSRIDLNATGSDGQGLLHYSDLSLEDLRRLVNAGADIELTGQGGITPLVVFGAQDFEKVKFLIQRGADVNHTTPSNDSALHQACLMSNFATIKLLVESGAAVDTAEEYWGTPLQALCTPQRSVDSEEHEEIVRYLISVNEDQKADVTLKAGILGYPIIAAAFASTPSIIGMILDEKGTTVSVEDDMGRMPVHLAACNGLPNFEAILEGGGDIYARDKQRRTPLHWAALGGRLDVVEKIISAMDDMSEIDAPDIDGWTPLCWALRGGLRSMEERNAGESSRSSDVIKLLLEQGASKVPVLEPEEEAWTPLRIAHYHRRAPDIMTLLNNEEGHDTKSTSMKNKAKREEIAGMKRGVEWDCAYCDYCLSGIYGVYWTCKVCSWMCFCFKCYRHVDILHPSHHDYIRRGTEEYEEGEKDTPGTATSGSSDTDSDSSSDLEGSGDESE